MLTGHNLPDVQVDDRKVQSLTYYPEVEDTVERHKLWAFFGAKATAQFALDVFTVFLRERVGFVWMINRNHESCKRPLCERKLHCVDRVGRHRQVLGFSVESRALTLVP